MESEVVSTEYRTVAEASVGRNLRRQHLESWGLSDALY
jgi:hypothetical protein